MITTGAVRDDGTSRSYVLPEYPAVASWRSRGALVAAARARGVRHAVGVTWSLDAFYARNAVLGADGAIETMSFGGYRAPELESRIVAMRDARVQNCEMESGILLTLAALFGLAAGCICVVSDRAPWPGPAELDIDKNMDACIARRHRRHARARQGLSALSVWAARALTPAGEVARVRVRCAGGRIEARRARGRAALGRRATRECDARAGARRPAGERRGGRARTTTPTRPRAARATDFHLRAGTTSLLATLVSAPLDHLEAAPARAARRRLARAGRSWASTSRARSWSRRSAARTTPRTLCDPTPERVSRLLDVAEGALRMVTLAPERAGALEAVARFARAGAVVAAGHSRATLAAGARGDRARALVRHAPRQRE